MKLAWCLLVLPVSTACSMHHHASRNAVGKGDARGAPQNLRSRDPDPPSDPGERVLLARVAAPAGGGVIPGKSGDPGFGFVGAELALMTAELARSHSEPQVQALVQEQPLHPALGVLYQLEPEDHDAVGWGRVYGELQYEAYVEPKVAVSGGVLLGAGAFYETPDTAGAHATLCGWFIGTLFVRPCVRPALRSDAGFEFSGYLALQGYLEWYTSR